MAWVETTVCQRKHQILALRRHHLYFEWRHIFWDLSTARKEVLTQEVLPWLSKEPQNHPWVRSSSVLIFGLDHKLLSVTLGNDPGLFLYRWTLARIHLLLKQQIHLATLVEFDNNGNRSICDSTAKPLRMASEIVLIVITAGRIRLRNYT